MSLLAFGINHKTAPVAIRERVSFAPDRLADALRELVSQPRVQEAAILSTCNRTELYCNTEDDDIAPVVEWFRRYHELRAEEIEPYIYIHPQLEAVRHIMRVASGLDSLVLGEPQILGQMKDAYNTANEAGTVGTLLGRLFQHCFAVAKQVRTDTAIGESPVSVAFAAVSLARQIFSDLSETTALCIGAGETIELAARHLHEHGVARMIIANRTLERAHLLAGEFGAYAIPLDELPAHLEEADIVVASTASPLPILGKGSVERALKARKHRPMFMVDIAVPRDIEPEVAELDDVYLYTVDDLQEVIRENQESRREAAAQAEEIVNLQSAHFMGWLRSLKAVDLVRAYRSEAERLRDQELDKARRLLARGDDPEQVLYLLARGLTNKLVHRPSVTLRQAGYDERAELIEFASELLGVKTDED